MMFLLSILLTMALNIDAHPNEGHMKPLGYQRKTEGHVEVTKHIPHGKTFYYKYSKGSTPLLIKHAAGHFPAFFEWTDTHMRRKFGHILVDVIEGNKNGSTVDRKYIFKDFLKNYQKDDVDIIMAHQMRKELLEDVRLLSCLLCGGYLNVLQEVYMWLSGKDTKTVLQQNQYDNFVCVFSGSKRFYMVNPKYSKYIKLNGPKEKFPSSLVDVDAVNLNLYPGISEAPWWEANMTAGDCLFIPANWFHQANSYVEEKKHMDINVLFYHMEKIDMANCNKLRLSSPDTLITFDGIDLDDKNIEAVRFLLMLELEDNTKIGRKKLFKGITVNLDDKNLTTSKLRDYQHILNKNNNVTMEEILQLSEIELKLVSNAFPGLLREGGTTKRLNKVHWVEYGDPFDDVKSTHDEL